MARRSTARIGSRPHAEAVAVMPWIESAASGIAGAVAGVAAGAALGPGAPVVAGRLIAVAVPLVVGAAVAIGDARGIAFGAGLALGALAALATAAAEGPRGPAAIASLGGSTWRWRWDRAWVGAGRSAPAALLIAACIGVALGGATEAAAWIAGPLGSLAALVWLGRAGRGGLRVG